MSYINCRQPFLGTYNYFRMCDVTSNQHFVARPSFYCFNIEGLAQPSVCSIKDLTLGIESNANVYDSDNKVFGVLHASR
jgi:hypothetical protein